MKAMPKGTRVQIKSSFRNLGEAADVYVTVEDSWDDRGEMPRLRIEPESCELTFPPIEKV